MNLPSFYYLNFQLMQMYSYSLSDLENMIPWERKIYIGMLNDYIKEENIKIQQKVAAGGIS